MMKILKLMLVLCWTYVVSDLYDEKIVETFYEKQLQKIIQKEFRDKK